MKSFFMVPELGTDRYFDLDGRLLPGKPERGIYIWKGKKYVAK